eukprot:GHVN01002060.1.p1 GENE.GHVN01002060.1~~GHVN01002060.1.p1  ORF type:complete len:284 (-),score=17.04 GHVN01002060.1:155-940(-)
MDTLKDQLSSKVVKQFVYMTTNSEYKSSDVFEDDQIRTLLEIASNLTPNELSTKCGAGAEEDSPTPPGKIEGVAVKTQSVDVNGGGTPEATCFTKNQLMSFLLRSIWEHKKFEAWESNRRDAMGIISVLLRSVGFFWVVLAFPIIFSLPAVATILATVNFVGFGVGLYFWRRDILNVIVGSLLIIYNVFDIGDMLLLNCVGESTNYRVANLSIHTISLMDDKVSIQVPHYILLKSLESAQTPRVIALLSQVSVWVTRSLAK